jgi:CheY-like chemotaxis protein
MVDDAACRKPKVLVVEDEWLVRQMVVDELSDAGFDLAEAASGDEAAAILAELDGFDLVFTDIRMPGELDGWRLAERARALHPQIKVVYATGYSAEQPRQVEGSILLRKPYRPAELIDTFASLGVSPQAA